MFSFLWPSKKRPDAMARSIKTFELPTFPIVILKASKLLRDPHSSLRDIANVLSLDPGLSVKLLRTVNSAAFGLRRTVKDVPHAVNLLGRKRVELLLLSFGVRHVIPHDRNTGFNLKAFWQLSARRAALAAGIAKHICPMAQHECFTAGLLQDMAVPFLVQHEGKPYVNLVDGWLHHQGQLEALEDELFGWTHAQVAEKMAAQWEFPTELKNAISEHHSAEHSSLDKSAVAIVASLREKHDEDGLEALIAALDSEFNIHADQSLLIVERSEEQAAEIAAMFTR